METKQVLISARKLIEKPEAWCQWSQGLDSNGRWIAPWKEEVVQRCALGAISAVVVKGKRGKIRRTIDNHHPVAETLSKLGMSGQMVGPFNNEHTHAEVLAAFDRAIKLAA